MKKFSMNNIFVDKTFIMFDWADPSYSLSSWEGRAYFVEENTGQISFIYRFPTQGEREQESVSEKHIQNYAIFIIVPLFALWRGGAPFLNSLYSPYASTVNNVLLLSGLTILILPFYLWYFKSHYRKLFANYQKSAHNYFPILLEDDGKEDILERAQNKRLGKAIVVVVLLVLTIMTGSNFIATSDMETAIIAPLSAAALIVGFPNPKDRWLSWRVSGKMLSDIRRDRWKWSG